MVITLDTIEIEVTKKKMKNLRIRVTAPQGRVLVSAPLRMKDGEIISVLKEKLDWIKSAVQKAQTADIPQQRSEEERLSNLLKILSEVSKNPEYRTEIDESALKAALRGGLSADKSAEIILKAKLSRLVPLWEKQTGLYCSAWKIKKVKSYWGKCSFQTRELTFNLSLAEKTDDCIEYVVLHELAHIRYPNHGKDFKAFLSKYMPQWSMIHQKLKSTEK